MLKNIGFLHLFGWWLIFYNIFFNIISTRT